MDFDEFAAVYNAYAEQRDADYKDNWVRMRLLATITIQPHLDKRHKITPEKLLPLPWDHEQKKHNKPTMTPAQQRKRMEELVNRFGDKLIDKSWQEKAR